MKEEIKKAVEEYQCPGCVCGSDTSCYEKGEGVECGRHVAGTTIMPQIGRIFLGMPQGFSRLGPCEKTKITIFEKIGEASYKKYDLFNVPVWKFLDKNGNTLVRGLCPRINWPFLHVFLGNVLSEIDCLEVTQRNVEEMD